MSKSSNGPPPKIVFIKLNLMDAMPGNREYESGMSKKSLTELAGSIKEKGIISPILVRPHPSKKDRFEIYAGCRRHVAAGIAELKEAPCIVTDITDAEARELRLIENVQREGIHEMEEARGYQDLLDLRDEKGNAVHTITSLAVKIGKSEAYVYARLKLLRMPDCAQECFLNGKCNSSIALLICRIPDPKKAHQATLEVMDRYGSGSGPEREKRAIDPEHETMSFRDAKRHIQTKYMRRLKGSKFDQEDETLVPVVYEVLPPSSTTPVTLTGKDVEDFKAREAARKDGKAATQGERLCGGKCSDCPFRTGNMKKLAPDMLKLAAESEGDTGSSDVCTNTACYAAKEKAHEKREQDRFKNKGQQLLSENKARAILNHEGDGLSNHVRGQYIDLREKAPGTRKTWEEVLEPHLPEGVTPIVARGKKNVVALEVTPEVLKAAKDAGVKLEKPKETGPEARAAEEEKREKRKEFLGKVVHSAGQLIIEAMQKAKPEELLRGYVLDRCHHGTGLVKWEGKEPPTEKDVQAAVKKMDVAELVQHLTINAINWRNMVTWQGELDEDLKVLCDLYKVDLKAVTEQVGKEQKALEAEAKAAEKKDAAESKAEPKAEKKPEPAAK